MIKCLACGEMLSNLQWTHFKYKCVSDINTIAEYRSRFPDAPLLDYINTVTLEGMIEKHGEIEGKKRWDSYREKQAQSNTFKYKQQKYGWSKEQFDLYNQSRAVTQENLVKRHGKTKGEKKWNDYCQRQAYAGCTLEYFQKKYGEVDGRNHWEELNQQKRLTLDTFIRKYGESEGKIKYEEYLDKVPLFYSKGSQELFNLLEQALQKLNYTPDSYYATKNREFHKLNPQTNQSFFYDYVIPDIKFCIEYNGDIYHANPKMYSPSDIPRGRGNTKSALEIWERDKTKNEVLRQQGYNVVIVWESDFQKHPDDIVQKLVQAIWKLKEQNDVK